ncbi:MAG: SUMF1/EgtB/PvdO family nonheme iron enzyme, partial [Opitutae bacterium]|nr:SUMF1/EgtB/PvdO family nonheme iron enzyme [Opitutae bacterium]
MSPYANRIARTPAPTLDTPSELSDKGKNMKKLFVLFPLFFTLLPALVWASPPVPFSGKVAIGGVNYFGQAKFAFAIHDANGTVHWRTGATANDAITVNVANGRYVVLLGGQGMNPLPASLFADHDELYIKVSFDNNDGKGLRHLAPDQRITAVPYALSAETAKMADSAKTVENSSITTAQLNEQILKYLKPEITVAPQAPGLFFSGQTISLTSQAQGKFLTYQWRKDGQPIAGATNSTITIADFNGSQHNGNYTLVVTNDFGSVTTQATNLQVDATPTSHTVASIGMEMIFCPPGTFTMGSPASEANRGTDETQHQVTLTSGFYLGKYEVTQAQYETVMTGNPEGLNAKPSEWPNNDNRPVEKVSWDDAQIFLTRLHQSEQTAGRLPTGWKYALPTEAQWEYACRAGTTTVFSWGNSATSTQANFKGTHPYGGGASGPNLQQTTDVGQYGDNPWGFFDMHGNVWEWVYDWKANFSGGAQTNPEGPASGSLRVIRGSSWTTDGT